ncbi:trehalose-6-phosphate synthase [Corynebacterium yudongzhengii]|uniref:alpha,alpha-trehalose-phosphate synthase (ADP-forming) n=1 Tax=Corynebacterium yudongzhengii TaxID=2080740 RepID=A0A2U1T5V0_9CORY|nr:trehalose-6-phosphate synthase [Corynebacterium yudongzhengii]AWB82609.1 trehalose-6-phosphate synthase [Corynebacterium yudongzhengii]PWC01343.1 trehalose-6-phosphate synthase [Corynebacterium yudongzhengii]
MSGDNEFVVVANRLPVDAIVDEHGGTTWTESPGGLVAALSPVLSARRGCWVGWPGLIDAAPAPFHTDSGILVHPVPLTADDHERFYEGFSNATLWPLYHDLIVTPTYHRDWWQSYRDVNYRFATEVDRVAAPGATVWVQDYQLQLVPGILRQLRPDLTIGFFLHIPFPGPDLFRQLPWREEVVRGLLGADLIGFHLVSNAENFLSLVQQVSGPKGSHTGQPDSLKVTGSASVRTTTASITASDGREVAVAAYPISIDPTSLGEADDKEVARRRAELGNPECILLGVDRLDYTKGILQRLEAFEELLEAGALDPNEVVFVQVATPSRERIEHYRTARRQVEEAVGRINGRFAKIGRPVVHYLHRSLPKRLLRHYYQAADVMVVTPFKDGMNLVAKEYVACHPDGSGALVLSEFAGAADELLQANLCNPFDIESLKRALLQAVRGLEHDPETMRSRMRAMHEQVLTFDVDAWANASLRDLDEARR